ncbi:MAG: TIM barrel protein [Clostridia bacterium]|nr:TIM barrel protein [Clostridia bacterium]
MIKFGPSGNSLAFSQAGKSKSEESAVWVKNLGLSCFEYSFGRGVNLTDERAVSIGKAFSDAGVEISVHAPYYINFANPEQENAEKSYGYVLSSAKKVKLMGGKRVVFHPASQGKMKREQAVDLTEERLKILRDRIYEENLSDLIICPETMGKIGQIGTIEEVTRFCKIDKIYIPAVDFGHINARECGSLKSEKDYTERLEYMISELGYEKMKNFHIHFSKIEYSAKGEVRHLTFEDNHYGPDFEPLALALKKLNLEPYIVCESAGTQDIDALKMQKIYYGN